MPAAFTTVDPHRAETKISHIVDIISHSSAACTCACPDLQPHSAGSEAAPVGSSLLRGDTSRAPFCPDPQTVTHQDARVPKVFAPAL